MEGAVPDLHLCAIKWYVCRVCYMVDSVLVRLDGVVGHNDAFAERDAKTCIGGGLCSSECVARFWIWCIICTCPGGVVWAKCERNACVDCGGISF